MKPAAGSRFGRNRVRIVYVSRFGGHRCGAVIHYGGRGGRLRREGEVAQAKAGSGVPNKAVSPVSNGTGSGGAAALPPSPRGQKSPCLLPRASSQMPAGGAGRRGSHAEPLLGEGQARPTKEAKAPKIMTEFPCSLNKDWGCKRAAVSPTASSTRKQTGGCEVTQGDVFEFPVPLENAKKMIRKPKKKPAVWHGVSKVISKMIEENGHFRNRLIHCSQLSSEGKEVSDNEINGAPCIDTDEAIFGWV